MISLNKEHIFECKWLNTEQIKLTYSDWKIIEQIRVFRKFMKSFVEQEKYDMRKAEQPHKIASSEPQFSDVEHCNGFDK